MNVKLTDEQWQKILPILKTFPEIRLGAGRDVRRFLEAVLWITRSGAHRATPESVIDDLIVEQSSIFEKLFAHFSRDRDLDICLSIRLSCAHACSSGAQKNAGNNLYAEIAAAFQLKFIWRTTRSAMRFVLF